MTALRKLQTYARLGPTNLARVGLYRLGLGTGLHPVQRLKADVARAPFLRTSERAGAVPAPNTRWNEGLWWFGAHREPLPDGPPDWFANPFSSQPVGGTGSDWWRIPDFASGDIKGVWELSRFDWVVAWATCAAHGDTTALIRLNDWLADWAERNPPYKGPNWKCGQEASIRVMHMALAALVLGQTRRPEPGLIELLRVHLQRIAPTMSYAIGQQNNHATSEAAALFIGGSLLVGHDPQAPAWMAKGRRWLENRAQVLIAPDGSFSQQSVTYHRLMLDTYALSEAWRRAHDLPSFSDAFYVRLRAAMRWLEAMTIAETGDAPNLGANDGANLMPLSGCDYRDFRPSVQLAAALFEERSAFGPGEWDVPLRWLDVKPGQKSAPPGSISLDHGGYHILRAGEVFALLRYPRYRTRPGQADALHLDLWVGGENLLCDAGSYSYNAADSAWFRGTSAHNTVTFDNRDQMPRLGRFLFGEWLQAEDVELARTEAETVRAAAAYRDYKGAKHHRAVVLAADHLICTDTLTGSFQTACLRWRLAPGDWMLEGQTLQCRGVTLTIACDAEELQLGLTEAAESRYYQQRQNIPVLEIRVEKPCRIETKVTF